MVGVPGKSKGCSTCRRRKKGCDQKRPICGQCSASGYVCGGYQRSLTFVLHPASKMVERAHFLPNKPRLPSLSSSLSLERSAVVSQCQSIFYDVYLPYGRCVISDQFILKCGCGANWTNVMKSFTSNETSLELAFAAFSISRVGKNMDDPRLVKESTKFYGRALKTLQRALHDSSHIHSEQILTACLLLCLYETFQGVCSTSAGWVSHALGTARILQLRGPERHSELPGHTLFLGIRLPIIYASILRRENTFLCHNDWLTIPWHGQPKSGVDRIIDITTHVPGLLEQFDAIRLQNSSMDQIQALQSCLRLCRHLQKLLATWNAIRRPNSEPVPIAHETTTSFDSYPFLRELTYENHLFLNANLIYWSTALLISTTASEVELLLTAYGFRSADTQSSIASAKQEAYECACNIVQSIPYCLWPEMGDMGINYVQFPMHLAFQFFLKSNEANICSWILERAEEMKSHVDFKASPVETSPTLDTGIEYDLSSGALESSVIRRGSKSMRNSTAFANTRSTSRNPPIRVESMGLYLGDSGTIPAQTSTCIVPSNSGVFPLGQESDNQLEGTLQNYTSQSSDSGLKMILSNNRDTENEGGRPATDTCRTSLFDMYYFTFVQENPAKFYIDRSEIVA